MQNLSICIFFCAVSEFSLYCENVSIFDNFIQEVTVMSSTSLEGFLQLHVARYLFISEKQQTHALCKNGKSQHVSKSNMYTLPVQQYICCWFPRCDSFEVMPHQCLLCPHLMGSEESQVSF